MQSPRVDIVILNWNGLADTLECLASIRQLTYPNIQVQVVDNASRDDEASVIKTKFPEVNVLREKENLGFCGGCNAGMKKALETGADYVMLLNNDTLVIPGLVDELLKGYSSLRRPGAVSPLIMHYPEKDKVWFSAATWESHWSSGVAGFSLTNGKSYGELKDKPPYETEFACGCCLFISTAVIKDVGLFDERYFAFFDEAEWCARMKRKNYTSYVIPSAYMYHKVGGTTSSLVMTYLMSRNRLLWIAGNLPFRKKMRTWPVIIKDLIWHWLNMRNLIPAKKQYQPKAYSRVTLRGFKDYLFGRFGKWNKKTERIIFQKP